MSNIETPCPSCGNTTLFLDNTRRLVCTWIQCKQPVVQDKLNALAAELATVKAKRDHWKQEAVWAAKEFMKERECFFQVSYMGQWEMEIAKDPDYQRAQAVLKEAGDE